MSRRPYPFRILGLAVFTLITVTPALCLDSLKFLGRFDNMRVQGLLREHMSSEDWIYDGHYNPLPLPSGSNKSIVRRFQSMDDSVFYDVDTLNRSSHKVGTSSPIVHGDFNGDGRRDYVGYGNWILLGTGSSYIGDSTAGNLIVPEIVADFDGDGLDDVGHKKSQPPGSWIIWWGDSTNPLETSSLLLSPIVVDTGFITGGLRACVFVDRYGGRTVAVTSNLYRWQSGNETFKRSAFQVNEAELSVHQDTIHMDSLLLETDEVVTRGGGFFYYRVGDTTILQGRNGRDLIYSDGLAVIDDGIMHPSGMTAGFGMDWHQRYLPYEFHVTDSVVTLMEFDSDSMKYVYTYEFPYGNLDSGSSMLYCSMFPDVTGDGYHELAISFEGRSNVYYTNVYDVMGSIPQTSVQTPDTEGGWGQPQLRDGRLYWNEVTDGECVIEISNLSGQVIQRQSLRGAQARHLGMRVPDDISSGLLLIRVQQNGRQQTFKILGTGASR